MQPTKNCKHEIEYEATSLAGVQQQVMLRLRPLKNEWKKERRRPTYNANYTKLQARHFTNNVLSSLL
jgi:hypothetical protein